MFKLSATMDDRCAMQARLEQQFLKKVSFFPEQHPDMHVFHASDLTYIDSFLPSHRFNRVIGGCFENPWISAEVEYVLDHYARAHSPMAWWVGAGASAQGADDVLSDVGLCLREQVRAMAAPISELRLAPEGASPLSIVRVSSEKAMEDFAFILASMFTPPDKHIVRFYRAMPRFLAQSTLQCFVAYEDHEPVTSGCLFMQDGMAGIYDIATHPHHRGRGYAFDMTSHLLRRAWFAGYRLAGLWASQDSLSMYTRMGFHAFEEFLVYDNHKLLEKVSYPYDGLPYVV